jgi:TetR/AcrR family transcriptional regulator, mexJK operon transcriptional repressor
VSSTPNDRSRSRVTVSAPVEEGRTARKRRAILEAATEVFLQHGYLGTSMDAVAARAAVSKQTVYKQFTNKDSLFTEVVLGTTVQVVDDLAAAVAASLEDTDDVEASLRELARGFLSGLLRPEVLRLRRLIIAEADRFPEIGRVWFDRGFLGSLASLGQSLQRLADRGLLRELDDPVLAAHQFAGLVMYVPLNQAMFCGPEALPSRADLQRAGDAAVRVFLAAYGPQNAGA